VRVRTWDTYVGIFAHFAIASTWKIPNVFPSASRKYPCQQVFGTANLGNATTPQSCSITRVGADTPVRLPVPGTGCEGTTEAAALSAQAVIDPGGSRIGMSSPHGSRVA
jgi:hypothetical protein